MCFSMFLEINYIFNPKWYKPIFYEDLYEVVQPPICRKKMSYSNKFHLSYKCIDIKHF